MSKYKEKNLKVNIAIMIIFIIFTVSVGSMIKVIESKKIYKGYNVIYANVLSYDTRSVDFLTRISRGEYEMKKGYVYDLTIQYTVNDKDYINKVENVSKRHDKIKIYYNEDDPNNIKVDTFLLRNLRFILTILIIVSVILVIRNLDLIIHKKYTNI